jgi:predicted nucleic acid-binding protein
MKALVDTSVWSESLRRKQGASSSAAQELQALISERRVAIIGPIRQEILSGVRDEKQFEKLRRHLIPFPDVTLTTDDYETAARFFNTCRGRGVQGSNTDFLICAVAARREFAIFTTDRDFERFAKHLPIALHESRERNPSA